MGSTPAAQEKQGTEETENGSGRLGNDHALLEGEIAFAVPATPGVPDIEVAAVIDFGELFDFPTFYDVPVTNLGELPLTLGTPTLSGPNAGAFLIDFVPVTIGSLETLNIELEFDPDGLGGPVSATLTIPSDDPDEPSVDVLLTGTLPALGPDISLASPVQLSLGATVGNHDIVIDNVGGSDLIISGVTFSGANAGAFSVMATPGPIPGGGFGFLTVQFDPAGLPKGPIEATLQIVSNDPVDPTLEVILTGGLPAEFWPITDVVTNTVNFFSRFNLIEGIGIGFDASWPHNRIGSATWVTDAPNGADYYNNAQPAPVIIFDLVEVVVLPGGNVELTFPSSPDTLYELERSVDGITFTKLSDTAVGGPGATTVITDTDPLPDPTVLYRVINSGLTVP